MKMRSEELDLLANIEIFLQKYPVLTYLNILVTRLKTLMKSKQYGESFILKKEK